MSALTPDQFRREHGDDARTPWWARLPGADADLYVPDADGEPDAPSIAFAAEVLPQLDRLRDEAAAYVLSFVDLEKRPLDGHPQVVCLTCEAARRRVVIEVNWPSMRTALWYVELVPHAARGWVPVGMGVTTWGPHDGPWPPEHVRLGLRHAPDEARSGPLTP